MDIDGTTTIFFLEVTPSTRPRFGQANSWWYRRLKSRAVMLQLMPHRSSVY